MKNRFFSFPDIDPLNTSVAAKICCANQLTGFYMRATLVFNGFKWCVQKLVAPVSLPVLFKVPSFIIHDILHDLGWYHLYNLRIVKKTYGGVLLLTLHGCFSRFLKFTNGTKLHKESHICSSITLLLNDGIIKVNNVFFSRLVNILNLNIACIERRQIFVKSSYFS